MKLELPAGSDARFQPVVEWSARRAEIHEATLREDDAAGLDRPVLLDDGNAERVQPRLQLARDVPAANRGDAAPQEAGLGEHRPRDDDTRHRAAQRVER